jgi:hypothetical protein
MSLGRGAAARACAVGVVGLFALASCSRRTAATEPRGPFLSVYAREGTPAARSLVTPAAVALALGGLAPEERVRLRRRLAESTDGALQRAAPGLFDLDAPPDAGAAVDPLRQSLPDLPALTAAVDLLGSPWEAPGISVHLGPVCEPPPSRCAPLFGEASSEGDSLLRRGRSLAWALEDAALLRVSGAARARLLAALREAQIRPSGTIAMVFAAARGAIDAKELDLLRHAARRALEPLRPEAPQRPWLDALVAARPDWELPIALDVDQLLVVPRLSALARLPDFVSEVESAGTFAWEVRPGGRSMLR